MSDRFGFGKNWRRFLTKVDDDRVHEAERSLETMLGRGRLDGLSCLDVGCGSGLFSLAMRNMGAASVWAFDYDGDSVSCTRTMRDRFRPEDAAWVVDQGSVLDGDYLHGLGQHDLVYSWGVLHHTGAMWEAMANVAGLVRPGGLLFIAIYNDQGIATRIWTQVKRAYNRGPLPARWLLLSLGALWFWLPTSAVDAAKGQPLARWREYRSLRGMSRTTDLVDWVGGYPFEAARAGDVVDFYLEKGFVLQRLVSTSGVGCNEFVFRKAEA